MPQSDQLKNNWQERPPKDWGEEEARRVALEVRRLRAKRSAQWLADRTNELGYAVSRSVISDLEIGRRRYVTTAELIVLAEALETAPIALLYPPPYDDQVEAMPTVELSRIGAVQWFSAIWDDPLAQGFSEKYVENLEPLGKARRIRALQLEARRLARAIEELRDEGISLESPTKRLVEISEQIRALQAEDDGR